MSRIPSIPGQILAASEQTSQLKGWVQELCQTKTKSFPGSQPVSFTWKSMKSLEEEDYWVCEKSDGVRCLLLILMNGITNEQETYFIDRKNVYRRVYGLQFPNFEDSTFETPATDTLLDGELVIDHDETTGKNTLIYLAFDLLVLEHMNLREKPLQSRYGRLMTWVVKPYKSMLESRGNPEQPFEIKVKPMERAYSIEQIFKEHIPKLQHGNDGLIFTCAESGYVNGTDPRMWVKNYLLIYSIKYVSSIKWKNPSENSIDFKIILRFPPKEDNKELNNFSKKPICELHQWEGGKSYSWFDTWRISGEEWCHFMNEGVDIHNKIAEFSWLSEEQNWKFLRFRDDKNDANHSTVVEKILDSIKDGVKAEELIKKAPQIRSLWKAREQRRGLGQSRAPVASSQDYKIRT
ncbi:hypothetical protein E3Q18_00469 [Wallemia mellicola]|nr:hypothetical protein E3Q18_00469 [Wallemia mellicola]